MRKSDSDHQNKPAKPSDPITINASSFRRRSASVSSSSSGSGSSPDTPGLFHSPSHSSTLPITIPSPSTSPILSYFLAQSPTKPPSAVANSFPFRKNFGAVPLFEEEPETESPVAAHARRRAAPVPGRLMQNPPIPDCNRERGANLLRRLSLSTPLAKSFGTQPGNQSSPVNNVPPNTAVSPPTGQQFPVPQRKPVRSATISMDSRKPRRAPSPMGERILKGHFDSFH